MSRISLQFSRLSPIGNKSPIHRDVLVIRPCFRYIGDSSVMRSIGDSSVVRFISDIADEAMHIKHIDFPRRVWRKIRPNNFRCRDADLRADRNLRVPMSLFQSGMLSE